MAATRVRIASSGLDPGSIFTIPNKKPEQVDSGFRRKDPLDSSSRTHDVIPDLIRDPFSSLKNQKGQMDTGFRRYDGRFLPFTSSLATTPKYPLHRIPRAHFVAPTYSTSQQSPPAGDVQQACERCGQIRQSRCFKQTTGVWHVDRLDCTFFFQ
jgi:hypothetical protein